MTGLPGEIQNIVKLLSEERLKALTTICGSAEKAIELHQDTLKLGSSMMFIIATVELAIRNSVSHNLNEHFGVKNWMVQPPVPFQWRKQELDKLTMALDSARKSEYAKLTQKQKHTLEQTVFPSGRAKNTSHLMRSKAIRKQIPVPGGKVIAELTFYFWKRLFGPDYEQTLWRTSLKKIFPNKGTSRAVVAVNLEIIYQTRNRLAHHEPVVNRRFRTAIQSIDYVIQNLGSSLPSEKTPLAKLLKNALEDVKKEHEILSEKIAVYKRNKDET
jgi:hypothetical protein